METVETIKKEQQISKLQESSLRILDKDGSLMVSTYNDNLTNKHVVKCVKRIKDAFPNLEAGFYDVFTEMVIKDNFTDKRLTDSIDHVISNCTYPCPTIAQFISWDKSFHALTYDQQIKKVYEIGEIQWKYFKAVRFPNRKLPLWIHVDDIEKYSLRSNPSLTVIE